MKASNSGAFNRVVNRRLYSKKVVLSVVFAFVMASSAFVIAATGKAGTGNVTPSLEAWTLLPSQGWTKGDIKGYSEGDFIPAELTLNKPDDSSIVGARLGFEWGKNPGTSNLIRGFDKVVMYGPSTEPDWIDDTTLQAQDPTGPYRPGEVGDPLFYWEPDVPPAGEKGTVIEEDLVTDSDIAPGGSTEYYSEDQRYWIAWDLVFDFDSPYTSVEIYCGGLLFETTGTIKGASYYHGSSLHIRILGTLWDDGHGGLEYRPSGGSQDVPINVIAILTPPDLWMKKTFDPDVRAPDEITTITLEIQNHGQTDAYMHDLFDYLPEGVEYVGLLKTWTLKDSTHVNIDYDPIHEDGPDPDSLSDCTYPHDPDPSVLHFEFTIEPLSAYAWIPGTAHDGSTWVRFFSFVVMVEADADPGVVTNDAELTYTDDNLGPFWAYASDDLTIIKVAVSVTKDATIDGVSVTCAAVDYDVDGNGWIDPDSGDTVTYVITVTNDGTVPMRFDVYETYDSYPQELVWSEPGTLLTEMLPPETELGPPNYVTNYFDYSFTGEDHDVLWINTVTVKAYDAKDRFAGATASETLDLVYPDASITKTADCAIVMKAGEVVDYTITVQNLGDSILKEFYIWDDMLDPVQYLYVATWENDDDDLSPGETLTLKSSGTPEPGVVIVPALAYHVDMRDVVDGKITNTVEFQAYDHQEHYLYRVATEEVLYLEGAIQITKTAVTPGSALDDDPTNDVVDNDAGLSGVVTYRIDVVNTGDVGLWWYYWDDMADPWTPVPESDQAVWLFPPGTTTGYYVGGCWQVEPGEAQPPADPSDIDGVYCAQVPVAGDGQNGVVAISTHDTFVGEEFTYEVKIYPHDDYWRAGVYFRYDEATGNGYLAHIYNGNGGGGGAVLYKVYDRELITLGTYYDPLGISKNAWHTLKVVVHGTGVASFFDVYVDGSVSPWISAGDTSGLGSGKIGLAIWDEGRNPVHVHFDDVLVKNLAGTSVLLMDSFETLMPMNDDPIPSIPIPLPPGVPPELRCSYDARLWAGYLEPGDPLDLLTADVRYYTYVVQDDDPDPLVDTEHVYGWHTDDGTDQTDVCCPATYVTDDDDESVNLKGWLDGWVYHDVNLDHDGYGDFGESGLGGWTVQLLDEDGIPIIGQSFVTIDGHYAFDDLTPGYYYVRESTLTNPELWFPTNPEGYDSSKLTVSAHVGTEWDFANALYAYIEGYKWLDWNMNHEWDQSFGAEPYLNGWVIHCDGWEYDDPMEDENGDPLPYTVELTALTGDSDGDGQYLPEDLDELWSAGYFKFMVKPGTYFLWEEFPEDDPLTPDVNENDWYETEPVPVDPEDYPKGHDNIRITTGDGPVLGPKTFGNVPLTTIWGYKYYDKDMMGDHDTVDPGLNDWTITLTGETNNEDDYPFTDMSTITATYETKDGWYQFAHLMPGTYTVGEELPVDQVDYWFMTTLASALSFDLQDPIDPTSPQLDIGNMRYAKIVGYKFMDEYGGTEENPEFPNRVMDDGEDGVSDWSIHFKPYGGDENLDLSPVVTWEEEDEGWYEIVDENGKPFLLPGKYEVWEDPEDWIPTTLNPVVVTIPAFPWGDPIVVRIDFGNAEPLTDPTVWSVLHKGWNMWSIPVKVDGLTAMSLLNLVGGAGRIVTWLDETTGLQHSYIAGWTSGDFPILQGEGYYVYATQDVSFKLVGDRFGTTSVALQKGWNLIGYNSLHGVKASELLGMVTGCNARIVTYLNGAQGLYHSYIKGWTSGDFDVCKGKAYLIYVDGPGTLTYS